MTFDACVSELADGHALTTATLQLRLDGGHDRARGRTSCAPWDAPASGTAALQQPTTLAGAWTDVPNATSGYSMPMTGTARFFRLVRQLIFGPLARIDTENTLPGAFCIIYGRSLRRATTSLLFAS